MKSGSGSAALRRGDSGSGESRPGPAYVRDQSPIVKQERFAGNSAMISEGESGAFKLSFDKGTLVLSASGAAAPAGLLAPAKWQWDGRIGAFRCAAMHYAQESAELRRRLGESFADLVPKPWKVNWPRLDMPDLRADQKEALEAWFESGSRGQIVMPTGTGKTEVALAAMTASDDAVLVVAPVRDLMYQWHRRIMLRTGFEAGVLGDSIYDVRPVTVTTYDSAYIHMADIGARFGLIVFDEEHHLPGRCLREAAMLSTAPKRLGLTATPERADGLHEDLEWLVGPVVFNMPLPRAAGRTIADYDVVRIPVALKPDEQARYDEAAGEIRDYMREKNKGGVRYTMKDLCADTGADPEARKVQKYYRIKQDIEDRAEEKLRVLEDLFKLHAPDRIIVFAGSNNMAMDVSRRFLVPAILDHSRRKERTAVLDGFSSGSFPVLVANQVLDEGVDVPSAKVAVVIGGQASTRQAKQRLGRILRKSGRSRAVLYEVVCEGTGEVEKSRHRRRSDAYGRTIHHRL